MNGIQTSLRSAGWVSGLSLGQLIVQFALQVALARYFGAGVEMDAFVAAISVPTVVSSVVVSSLSYAVVPLLSARLVARESEEAWSAANGILLLLVAVTGMLTVAIVLLSGRIVAWLFPGFPTGPREMTVQLLQILAGLVVTNGLIAFAQAVHHSHQRFTVPGAAPIVGTGVTLAIVLRFPEHGIVAAAWGVLIGSAVASAIQMAFPLRHFRLSCRIDPGVRRFLWLSLPLICGAMYFRLDPLVDRYLASRLPTGNVSHLGYASRLVTALLLVSTGGLSVVAFPSFAAQRAAGRSEDLAAEVSHALRSLCLIVTPIVVGLACYSQPIVRDLFQRGRFSPDDTQAVSLLLVVYLAMVAASAFCEVAAKVFYALSDTKTPTLVGCLGFTAGVALKVVLTPRIGIAGVAAGTSLYCALVGVVLGVLLYGRVGPGVASGVGPAALRAVIAAAAAALCVLPIVWFAPRMGTLFGAPCGAAAYLGVLLLQRDETAQRLRDYVWRRGARA